MDAETKKVLKDIRRSVGSAGADEETKKTLKSIDQSLGLIVLVIGVALLAVGTNLLGWW